MADVANRGVSTNGLNVRLSALTPTAARLRSVSATSAGGDPVVVEPGVAQHARHGVVAARDREQQVLGLDGRVAQLAGDLRRVVRDPARALR